MFARFWESPANAENVAHWPGKSCAQLCWTILAVSNWPTLSAEPKQSNRQRSDEQRNDGGERATHQPGSWRTAIELARTRATLWMQSRIARIIIHFYLYKSKG
jgi:hypothetical protein